MWRSHILSRKPSTTNGKIRILKTNEFFSENVLYDYKIGLEIESKMFTCIYFLFFPGILLILIVYS